jgi:hypothetical protein
MKYRIEGGQTYLPAPSLVGSIQSGFLLGRYGPAIAQRVSAGPLGITLDPDLLTRFPWRLRLLRLQFHVVLAFVCPFELELGPEYSTPGQPPFDLVADLVCPSL